MKARANQTGKATEEISAQIVQIQEATRADGDCHPKRCLNDCRDQRDRRQHRLGGGAAERGDAGDLAERARGGTQEVSSNIAGVKQAATDTGAAAGEVLGAAQQVSRQAEELSGEVGHFIADVKAAA